MYCYMNYRVIYIVHLNQVLEVVLSYLFDLYIVINSSFSGYNYYVSPGYPYRDFVIRFGLVWNFFS
jgi:hypothetical protein